MKVSELLANAKAQFDPLLVADPVCDALLVTALGEFQARSGCTQELSLTDEEADIGINVSFTSDRVFYVLDSCYMPHGFSLSGGVLKIHRTDFSDPPYQVTYSMDIRSLGPDDIVPERAIQPVLNYLATLIKIQQLTAEYTTWDTSGVTTEHLESIDSVKADKERFEKEMDEMALDLGPALIVE